MMTSWYAVLYNLAYAPVAQTASDGGVDLTLLGVTCNAYARSLPEDTSHGVDRLTPWLAVQDPRSGVTGSQ